MDTMFIPRDQLATEAMMRLATGQTRPSVKPGPRPAFTLVELVIVMSLMVIAISAAAPSFRTFLTGRNQESEAWRFLALTRYGSSRAVSEGLPVDLWINIKQNKYGMAASGGYTETKTNALNFIVDTNVLMVVTQAPGMLTTVSNVWTPLTARRGAMPVIHFQPDGFISDTSPQTIKFTQGQDPEIWIVENTNHTRYEIQLNHAKSARR
jgi:prepilin-type N-terminal cleavage/methylation domain-containing protein